MSVRGAGHAAGDAEVGTSVPWSARPFIVLLVLLFALEFLGGLAAQRGLMDPAARAAAQLTATLARATGVTASAVGNEVLLERAVLQMSVECTGLFLVLALAALVLATPSGWRLKLEGLLIGTATVLLANQIRLVLIAHASRLPEDAFLFLHDYLFQIGMLVVVLVVWGCWLSVVTRREG